MPHGPRNLISDVDGILVGHAQDDTIKTGVSVITSDASMTAACFVMGGAPGTRETDLLAPDKTVTAVDAIVLSGGSAFGLSAASGVCDRLKQQGRGFGVAGTTVPIVPAAILFDLANGGQKDWRINPYQALGCAALEKSGHDFDLGTVGAGTGALCGMIKGGLGSASLKMHNGGTVGALVAANPIGNVTDSAGTFWAAPWEINGEFGGQVATFERHGLYDFDQTKLGQLQPNQNTTIGVVATDYTLDKSQLHRLAVAAHDGIARAILPSHLPFDGDLIFAVSTGRRPAPTDPLEFAKLGHYAAACVARSIARGIYRATPAPGDVKPTWAQTFKR